MKLSEIAAAAGLSVTGNADVEITGISLDSRQVRAGHLFAALPGTSRDGRDFVTDAVTRGAAAVLVETPMDALQGTPQVVAPAGRKALAELSAAFYGRPARQLTVIGITGTNGKTTTSFFTRDIFSAAARWPGLIGTVRYEIGERAIPAARTTPEAPDLHRMMAEMVKAGCRSVVMEVSSHALAQDRVLGIEFDIAVFTNMTSDHLDYHETVEKYFDAKRILFRQLLAVKGKKTVAVVNNDDPWGRRLITEGDVVLPVTFGFSEGSAVRAVDVAAQRTGSMFRITSPWGDASVQLQLLGRHNISNALAAVAAACSAGIPLARAVEAIGRRPNVPGRLEEIPTGKSFQVFVDYAHTEDALRNVLSALRELKGRKLIVVFGCGGTRDKTKRTGMGRAAAELADFTYITSDNPRNEPPGQIIDAIKAGFSDPTRFEAIEDRRDAIRAAVSRAERGDLVLIAGKGHETFQEFENTKVPFDDRQIVREVLKG